MAKIRKAARGKRRWVGLSVDDSITNREELESIISQIKCLGGDCRLYDYNKQGDKRWFLDPFESVIINIEKVER